MPSQGRVRRCFPRRLSLAREGGPRVGTSHLGYQRYRTWLSSKYASMFTYTGISIFLDYPEYRPAYHCGNDRLVRPLRTGIPRSRYPACRHMPSTPRGSISLREGISVLMKKPKSDADMASRKYHPERLVRGFEFLNKL